MANIYNEFQQKVGGMLIVIWPIAVIGVLLSVWIIGQDLKSTVFAYDLLPTQKPDQTIIDMSLSGGTGMIVNGMEGNNFNTGSKTAWVVGILLLVTQIVFFYMYTIDTTRIWARSLAMICFFFDTGTDVFFKMYGEWDIVLFFWAVLETVFIYTFVSEFLFVTFTAFVFHTAGAFFTIAGEVINGLIDAALEFAGQDTERHSGGTVRQKGGTNTGQRSKYANATGPGPGSRGRGRTRTNPDIEAVVGEFMK